MSKRVYCLYRVSTEKQVDHNEQNQADIPMQRKACRDFADKMGWEIVREEQEQGVSGFKVSAADRDKLQLIREHAAQGRFDILLVFMFDRIGRKSDETPFVVEWFSKHGVQVWSTQEGEQRFDNHTDRLTNYIRYWQADGESQKTSMRTRTALEQMVLEGRYRGGGVPYGYRLEKSGTLNKRKQEINKLVIDEDEARVVRLMYDMLIGSGYGRWRLTNFLNERGIPNRDGKLWHDGTIGRILQNIAYTGVLHSGKSFSEPFEELQIINPKTFALAQHILQERLASNEEKRTMPRHTAGQSLLSGNVFCGHCGGRLTLTTSGKSVELASGEVNSKKRIRYACYNKSRRRMPCDGQSGYTMHKVDSVVSKVLHQIFDKMKAASAASVLGASNDSTVLLLKKELHKLRQENAKVNKEYESLKTEIVKAVQGQSSFPMDVLSELVETKRQQVISLSERIAHLTVELDDSENRSMNMKAELDRLISWSEMFDSSPMETKKMIAGYIFERVTVSTGYEIEFKLSINVQQFMQGLEMVEEQQMNDKPDIQEMTMEMGCWPP